MHADFIGNVHLSLPVCRPVLNNYVATKQEMQTYSAELMDLYTKGAFKLEIWKDGYPFSAEGLKQAHDDLGEDGLACLLGCSLQGLPSRRCIGSAMPTLTLPCVSFRLSCC